MEHASTLLGGGRSNVARPFNSVKRRLAKKLWNKKSAFHPGAVWLKALCGFENDLHEHVEKSEKDQLRFQTGRLFRCLIKCIKAEATGKDQWVALFASYQFVTDTSRHLGYDEARRLHCEEMAAKGLSLPRSFCSLLAKQFARAPERFLEELILRVRSIASWMEAQECFSLWLVFKQLRWAWRGGDIDERARAIQAYYLSQLPQRLLTKTQRRSGEVIGVCLRPELRVGANYDNKPWNAVQWQDILGQAARLIAKQYDYTELERWVWWCYPVFKRYHWNTREVIDAACRRGFTEWPKGIDQPIRFRRHWMSCGLRFSGKKQKRDRTPPLAQFVENVALPDPRGMWGKCGWIRYEKKLSGA